MYGCSRRQLVRILVVLLLVGVALAGCSEKPEDVEWAPRGVAPVEPDGPRAKFVQLESQLYVGGLVQFEDQSKDGDAPIVHWYWDFGDGKNSVERHGEHNFEFEGVYTVTLTVTDTNAMSAKAQRNIAIGRDPATIPEPEPEPPRLEVYFDYEIRYGTTFFTSYVINGSDNRIEYYWDFGDGLNGRVAHPEHTYQKEDWYDISLVVRSDDGREATMTAIVPMEWS